MIDDYREHLGLTEDPFSDEVFYPAASHLQVMETVIHDVQFAAQAVVLTGSKGAGKSTLLTEIQRRLPQEVYRLVGDDFSSTTQLLEALAEELLLPLNAQMTQSALETLIANLAIEQDPSAAPVILVDAAEQLPPGAMLSLLKLAEPVKSRRALRLVMVCPPGLAIQMPVQLHRMPNLSLAEACALLNYRLVAAGYSGAALFEPAKVKPWWQQADGNIADLQAQAQQWLLTEAPQQTAPVTENKKARPAKVDQSPLPLVHMISAAALLGTLALFYLYRSDGSAEQQSAGATQRVEIPRSQPVAEPAAVVPKAPELPINVPAPEVRPQVAVTTGSEEKSSIAQVDSGASSSAKALESSASVASADSDVGLVEEQSASSDSELRPPASRFNEDEQRLLSWPGEEYTLQVLAVSRRQSAETYRAQYSDLPLLIVETQRRGSPWFVVVTGRYATSDKARQHSFQLPAAMRDAGPWPRLVGEIQREMEALADRP